MIGIQGISAIQEPNGPKSSGPGRAKDAEKPIVTSNQDGVTISPEAEKAAEAKSVVSDAAAANELRQERIEQAKERIEEGTYKVQDVVRQVASRLTRFVS